MVAFSGHPVVIQNRPKSDFVGIWVFPVFDLPKGVGEGWTPQLFFQPPYTLSNYIGDQLYIVYIRFTLQFCSVSDRRKVQPQLIFYNSNNAELTNCSLIYRAWKGRIRSRLISQWTKMLYKSLFVNVTAVLRPKTDRKEKTTTGY